jgi:hypothetical protein
MTIQAIRGDNVLVVELKRIGRKVVGCSLFSDMCHISMKKNDTPVFDTEIPEPAALRKLKELVPGIDVSSVN